jgi:predicted glycogen debranching enzyme
MVANQPTRLVRFEDYDPLFWEKKKEEIILTFNKAAETFIKKINGETCIWAASRDWFLEEWGRDTFISLEGLLLVDKRYKEAESIIKRFAKFERNGLIPNRIPDSKTREAIQYNSADASMWFIQAIKKFIEYTNDWELVKEIQHTIKSILENYINGTEYYRYGRFQKIYMDKDGLIVSPPQATWMDADAFGKIPPVTPRNGKVVEINSLWYSNLKFLKLAEVKLNTKITNVNLEELAYLVKKSFNEKFWNEKEQALFDVIEGDVDGNAIRPNMIIAVSHGEDLLPMDKQIKIFNKVNEELLTPAGLRTLSPKHQKYRGTYNTYAPIEEKDLAYHQGTAWPWLIGPYCDALAKIRKFQGKNSEEIREEIKRILYPLVKFCLESPYKSLPELFSGDYPHEPGGTTSQAWSVAEVRRVLIKYKIT